MKPEIFKNYAVGTASIIFCITFIIFTAGYLYNNSRGYEYAREFADKWVTTFQPYAFNETTVDDLSIYPTCNKIGDSYSAILEIENYGDNDVKNINCRITDNGGLKPDAMQQNIAILTPESTDACIFTLKGNFSKPLKFEITYGKKSVKTLCAVFDALD